MNAPKKFF